MKDNLCLVYDTVHTSTGLMKSYVIASISTDTCILFSAFPNMDGCETDTYVSFENGLIGSKGLMKEI